MKTAKTSAAIESITAETAIMLWQEDKKGFKLWALGLAGAKPVKKNKDIDGMLEFVESDQVRQKILVQVKGDEDLVPGMISELSDILEKDGAQIGLIISLQKPRLGMITDSVHAGSYDSPLWKRQFLKIQIRTVGELLEGKTFDIPQTCKPARKRKQARPVDTERLV
jgi:site-specific DNA-methyltransferase (adenine-specific)